MQVEALHWKKNQPLAEDYIQVSDQASGLFNTHFKDAKGWEERAAWLLESQAPKANRQQLIQVLKAFNENVGNSPQALKAIDTLANSNALTVVGGQQSGLFGGPLHSIYKVVTLLQLAREWSDKLARPIIPVFWIAGEDHDFDEVNHIYYLSGQMQVEKLKVEHPSGHRTSVSRLPLQPEAWREAIEALDVSLMDTEFKGEILSKLRELPLECLTLTGAFARIMANLFGEYGLVLMDSDDPALRQLEAPMFEQLVNRNEELCDALLEGKAMVEHAGYVPQADVHDQAANLFVFEASGRLLLQREGELFTDKKKDYTYTKSQLLDIIHTSPERLSNNVMTRPIMQEFLFPVLATVLGAGEISYWGLTKKAFQVFGMKMPIVAPRLEFTLLEGAVQKNMAKYGLTWDDILHHFEEKQQDWLNAQDTLQLTGRFGAVKEDFQRKYEPLVELLGSINPGVKKLGETNLAKIIEQIDFLEGKANDAHKSQFDSALRQWERIRLSILPFAKPQERVYNVHTYLNRYGDGWIKQLIETPIPVDGLHRVYYL
jgi:bacillithiol biosynthesis cysteine-adding enzyme BshC